MSARARVEWCAVIAITLLAMCWRSGVSGRPGEGAGAQSAAPAVVPLVNDAHVHLTNYVQEGPAATKLLQVMGSKVGRATLFGIPLQQLWSHRVSGDDAPTYYLDADTPLYYYSFTDAYVAMQYRALRPADQQRFDPMITGFNPADMYAADHVLRVLRTFPGVFTGIGEFSVHKEFVSPKVAGEVASLTDPALDRLLDVAGDVGLLVILHCDIDVPFPKPGAEPAYWEQLKALFARHPDATIVWAHVGLGRVIRPIRQHAAALESILRDSNFGHVHFDISWNEVAKYIVSSPESVAIVASLLNRYPDRFLYGSDEVGATTQAQLLKVYEQYGPLWNALDARASELVRRGNYVRLFDAARRRVRAWEKADSRR